MHRKEQDGEEEIQTLIGQSSAETVESKELLCKSPDNSGFLFRFPQSSIWSPLVPIPYAAYALDSDCHTARKFSCEGLCKKGIFSLKNKIGDLGVNLKGLKLMKKKKKMTPMKTRKGSGLSPAPSKAASCAPVEWKKMLKVVSKGFKKTKKDRTAHVKLSVYLNGL